MKNLEAERKKVSRGCAESGAFPDYPLKSQLFSDSFIAIEVYAMLILSGVLVLFLTFRDYGVSHGF